MVLFRKQSHLIHRGVDQFRGWCPIARLAPEVVKQTPEKNLVQTRGTPRSGTRRRHIGRVCSHGRHHRCASRRSQMQPQFGRCSAGPIEEEPSACGTRDDAKLLVAHAHDPSDERTSVHEFPLCCRILKRDVVPGNNISCNSQKQQATQRATGVGAHGFDLLGVPPTRHNDEVVPIHPRHSVKKKNRRRCSLIRVYFNVSPCPPLPASPFRTST